MYYRTLGKTALEISEIGFGCGNVGGMMVRDSHEEQVRVLRRALELGGLPGEAMVHLRQLWESDFGAVLWKRWRYFRKSPFGIFRSDLRHFPKQIYVLA